MRPPPGVEVLSLIRIGVVLVAAILTWGTAKAADHTGAALALISVDQRGEALTISGSVLALQDISVTGELSVVRNGNSGRVSSRQGGQLTLRKGERGVIAEVTVSYRAGDALEISAEVRQGGAVVSRSTVMTVMQ